ncbi:MAG: 2-oxo-4-hydroxy-4-carboxy-5-ureidoimidazoline decarboxylase [Cyanobacteria bacterium P01_A01_bin.114]
MGHLISAINQMNPTEFVTLFGAVFEATPAVAQQTWQSRPFTDSSDLHQKMVAVVAQMPLAEKLALIQAHPDLGSPAKMADASVQEQAGAGLNQLSPSEYERFQSLNVAYKNKFGFPFILAVKGHTQNSILKVFESRLNNNQEAEIQQALLEIAQIARFRLDDLVEEEKVEGREMEGRG